MKYSTKLSDAVHILVLIAMNPYGELSSTAIANSVHTNPGFVRQIMASLRKANIISSITGHAKPSLKIRSEELSLYQIYQAVEGDKPLLHLDTHTNPECGVGINIQLALQKYYEEIQACTDQKMKAITLQNIIDTYSDNLL